MQLKLVYEYDSSINNSRVCIVYDNVGKEIARGYHHQLFDQAKWSALREAQRVLALTPISIPEPEYCDVTWGR